MGRGLKSDRVRFSKVWIFDLDNTLHNALPHIFPHINQSMTGYVQQLLKIDEAEASALRVHYWQRYGATLLGLMRHHGVAPRHFLWHTHQFQDLGAMVVAEKNLRHTLRRLPGKKFVFSNAPAHYTREVLAILRVSDLFDRVFTVEHTRWKPKPSTTGFLRVLGRMGVPPEHCIMVEDDLTNLKTAKKLGMRTVWVSKARKCPPFVDVVVKSILQLPGNIRRL